MKLRSLLALVATTALLLCWTDQRGIGSPIESPETKTTAEDELLDLDFKGGTAEDYVNAIRKQLKNVNIVIMPSAASLPMPPIQLRSVQVYTALELLDGQTAETGTEYIEVHTRYLPGNEQEGAADIYSIFADGASQPSRTSIFAVNSLLSGGLSSDDLMTSIETMLDLISDSYAPAQIRFHPETSILIVRGHPGQVETIKSLIGELHDSVRQSRQRSERNAIYERAVEEARQNAEKNQSLQEMYNHSQLALTEMEARYALQSQETARLQDVTAQCDMEKRQLAEENHVIMMRMQDLQRQLAELKDGKD